MSDLETFRSETRSWLEANCPAEMRKPVRDDDDVYWGGRNATFKNDAQKAWFEVCRVASDHERVLVFPRQLECHFRVALAAVSYSSRRSTQLFRSRRLGLTCLPQRPLGQQVRESAPARWLEGHGTLPVNQAARVSGSKMRLFSQYRSEPGQSHHARPTPTV